MALVNKHSPGRGCLQLLEGIKEEPAHCFLQEQGDDTRKKEAAEHPSPVRDMKNVHAVKCGSYFPPILLVVEY